MNLEFTNKNVTVIIRTVGERTTDLCYELIKKQIAEDNIHIINETPFTEAMRKTFEVGLRENRKWTFVVDADVLIRPGVIEEIVEYAETVDENVFEIEGKIIDKFLFSMNPREAGNHLYRTAFMKQALNYIPDPYEAIRPETYVRNKMNDIGYAFIKTNILTGLHDFEQYYKDIYRKCFIQAKKHKDRVIKILPVWKGKSLYDDDFKVAIAGFDAGLNYSGKVSISSNELFLLKYNDVKKELNLKEKNLLGDIDYIDNEKFLLFMNKILTDIAIERHLEIIKLLTQNITNKKETKCCYINRILNKWRD